MKPDTSEQEKGGGFLEHIPLGRYGQPEDIVGGIIYLVSDASSYVTGQTLVIDGGLTGKLA